MTYIDIHVLQTLPPNNLNRDDTGAPKSALYGGVRRTRVSSQAWKKATRDYFCSALPVERMGSRTKDVVRLVSDSITRQRPDLSETAVSLAVQVLEASPIKLDKPKKGSSEIPLAAYLIFLSRAQVDLLAEHAIRAAEEDSPGEYLKGRKDEIKSSINMDHSVDLALFGRMITDNKELSVDAACQVAHSISVDAAEVEHDYYTALDDVRTEDQESGAGMIGTMEFSSSTLYRYANVNLEALARTLGDESVTTQALETFIDAFIRSMPTGKQNSFAARTLPEAVVVSIRDQPLSLARAFHRPVDSRGDGVLNNASQALTREAREIEEQYDLRPALTLVARIGEDTQSLDDLGERVTFPGLAERVTQHLKQGEVDG